MRIDLDSVAYRPEFMQQKPSGESHEMNARGENVRGRIIDVNQNIVLIQTSTGKQFSATTTVPMENFIGQEMSFAIMVGVDGELILKPEIDAKNQKTLIDLKIEDILNKLGKQITPENKDIIKQMMKSSMPISKNNFEEIKELKFAMDLLKTDDFFVKLQNGDESKELNNLLKEIQTRKDFGLTQKSDSQIIEKDANLKDILLLKNLDLKVNISNIKALYEMLGKINSKQSDLTGVNSMINDKNFVNNLKTEVESMKYSAVDILEENSFDENFNTLNQKLNNTDKKTADTIDKTFKNMIFEDFSEELKDSLKAGLLKDTEKIDISKKEIKSDDIIEMLKNIEKNLTKKLDTNSKHTKEDLKVEYDEAKNEIKSILNILSKDGDTSKIMEKQLMPKLDILSNMVEKYNYNIVAFKMGENYENVLQYYVKKGKKSLKTQDEINIGLSIDTQNYGNVKTMVNYNKKSNIKLDFFTEDKNIKSKFDTNISSLRTILKTMGFSNIDIKVSVRESKQDLIDDVLFDNSNLKTFEMWI